MEFPSIVTADGVRVYPGEAVWVLHDDGSTEQRTIVKCLGHAKAEKVEWTVQCSKGYIGARRTVIYRHKPEVGDARSSHADGGDSQNDGLE